jgi:hypothetical protein
MRALSVIAASAVLIQLTVLVGCESLLRPSPEAARAWHAAQMAALADAWVAGQDSFVPPDTPPQPWGIGSAIPQAYQAVLACRSAEEEAWQALVDDSMQQANYCVELLAALYARQVSGIEKLSSEWEVRHQNIRSLLEDYAQRQAQTQVALDRLKQAWTQRWEEQDLDFDLSTAKRDSHRRRAQQDAARISQLRNFHEQSYSRLQLRYLEWAAPLATSPAVSAHEAGRVAVTEPGGIRELRDALHALESALIARDALERQVAVDVEIHRRYAGTGQTGRTITSQRYREPRLAVAQARLAMFSRINQLLSAVEDVLQTHVTRQWQVIWPDCDVETNIYAWAGLPRHGSGSAAQGNE